MKTQSLENAAHKHGSKRV